MNDIEMASFPPAAGREAEVTCCEDGICICIVLVHSPSASGVGRAGILRLARVFLAGVSVAFLEL